MINRRQILSALAAGAIVPAMAQTMPDVSLGAIGAVVGVAFGSAFDREIFTDDAYRALIAREAKIATTENSLKFDWLRPKGPAADFEMADRLVAFAERNTIRLRGTALVWNDYPPPWLSGLSTRELVAIFDRHIDEAVGRYRGRLFSWDVVNEPFFPPHGNPGGFRKGPWYAAMGKDYVARAFRRAAAADPSMVGVLNEAFCEQDDTLGKSVRPRLLGLVDELKDQGVPLGAVGLQGHLKPQLAFDDRGFVEFLHALAERKVDIYITELDVDDMGFADEVTLRDQAVAQRYGAFLTAVLSVPAVKAVITWHLSDRYSWYRDVALRRNRFARAPRPLPYDETLARKPAWNAIASALAGRRS